MEEKDLDRILKRKIGRGDFLKLGAAAAGASVLAACGADEEEAAAPAPAPAEPAPPAAAPAAPARPPIEEEPGDLHVFEWTGYDYPTYGEKGGPLQPYVDAYGKPKYTPYPTNDQGLAKFKTGFTADLAHPCVGWHQEFIDSGRMQPFDTSLISNFQDLSPALLKAGQFEGEQWLIPADWSYEAPMYNADKVEPKENSWSILYDEDYAGKITWWDDALNLVYNGYYQGFADPWNMTDAELEDAKKFLSEKKKIVRNFWLDYTELWNDFTAGNVWIAYAWPDAWVYAKSKGVNAVYMFPDEGAGAWVCGFMLYKDSENYHHAHEYVDAWVSVPSLEWLTNNYGYGNANTKAINVDKTVVEAFKLNDPTALEEPKTHLERFIPRRADYVKAWDEVKAA